ncbi:hypothetical protein BH11BAC4_BH11BAC4_18130 [soil metagenome]
MQFEPLDHSDFHYLKEFEPPGWGDLVPRFRYCIDSSFCHPIKLKAVDTTVAIGTTILHKDSAWLASIIVHPDHRTKGYGNKITQQLVDSIDMDRYTTIFLDATAFGYPVYKKMGFQHEATYAHLKAAANITGVQFSKNIIGYQPKYLEQVLQLDKNISCEDRQDIIMENISTAKLYLGNNQVEGFYMASLGNGLILAANDTAGIELMKCRIENNCYGIMPEENTAAIAFLQEAGLEQFRISRRMFIGRKREWKAKRIYNRISGQLG